MAISGIGYADSIDMSASRPEGTSGIPGTPGPEAGDRHGAPKTRSGKYEGPVAPVVASILAVMAWAIFILLYALFWSTRFSIFQNIIVTIVSLVITGLLIGLMWVILSPRGAWRG